MKSSKFLTLCIFLLANLFLFAVEQPSKILKKQFQSDYNLLIKEVNNLTDELRSNQTNWDSIASQFFTTRIAYKKIELFVDYLDHEFVKDHINGAPLPSIERKAPDLVVLDPSGFQIMEETLIEQDKVALLNYSIVLEKKILLYAARIPRLNISERMVFEALREELIRLTALGITAFDTPSEINTMAEITTVVNSLQEIITRYNSYINCVDDLEIENSFSNAKKLLSNTTFQDFNQFEFIRTFINPLYKKLLEIQHELHIETRDLGNKKAYSVNYESESMFDTDFLNYKYYSKYSVSGVPKEREKLGKLLFFDPILSQNNERACASCHQPEKAFSDGLKTSLAFNGEGNLDRNSPGLINSVFNTRFFWDLRAETPEDQIEHVLFNPKEFNTNYDEIISKINSCENYISQFEQAYPENVNGKNPIISRYTIVASISAYLQSLRSYNSEFDKAIKSNNKSSNENMVNGFNLFTGKGKCATCHFIPTFAGNVPPLYIDTETEVLGIPNVNDQSKAELDQDQGRYLNGRRAEHAEHNKFAFKTPTIRNIKLTAPYMHNGVFETLEEVVEFYNVGGGHGWGIAPENTTLPTDSLHLTELEIDYLILFMESLTDTTGFLARPKKLPISSIAKLNSRLIGGRY